MKIIYIPLIIIAFISVTSSAIAQSSKADSIADSIDKDKSDKKASFKFGASYLNNNVFMGRSDTIKTPVILPELKYTFKNGIFVSAGADYIPNRTTNKLDGGSLELGYDYDITEDLSGGVSFTKLFL